MDEERKRLVQERDDGVPWKRWGPYLSERQWGTVREDYSESGDAWSFFTHDMSRSRAYRWGEDGLLGISDDKQRLCFALALWNGKDPILKERLFGLTNSEGNHGEDCKEYYFYLDSTPTHSWMKALYKYPQAAYPYDDLVATNRKRTRHELEYELLDTGVFADSRYFDVFVEYAKATPDDVLIRISVANRGPEAATLHVLPHLWFRNTWWDAALGAPVAGGAARPELHALPDGAHTRAIAARHPELGEAVLHCDGDVPLLFTENESNEQRLFGKPNPTPYVKDAFNEYLLHGRAEAVNPARTGTKAAAHWTLQVGAGKTEVLRLRLVASPPGDGKAGAGAGATRRAAAPAPFGPRFDELLELRRREADAFYEVLTPPSLDKDRTNVMRQALAGMLWSKQYYEYDVDRWLRQHGSDARSGRRSSVRNADWYHMVNGDIISMPDKWEYPWYAAWDLAFHNGALVMVDPDFAKQQLDLMLRETYMHPNGQLPAYEWNFSDVNPPVHAWAALFVYRIDRQLSGTADVAFLKHCFQKLLMNFTWWVNRKDRSGRNVFEGGFLGLDNIGLFDRSSPLPTGGWLEQADGTAWMAMYCQNMLEIAFELSLHDSVYEDLASKFYEHFLWIASAMDRMGENVDELWDEEDGFFYDLLRLPDGRAGRVKVRSVVGLLSLCATTVFPSRAEIEERMPRFVERARAFAEIHPELVASVHSPGGEGVNGRAMLALLDERKLRRVLSRLLDENEFLGPHGIRALSRHHKDHPFVVDVHGQQYRVDYEPAESTSGMFGGNSNWRGPVWMPMNVLLIRALLQFYLYYGEKFRIEYPTGSGKQLTLFEVARAISERVITTFTRDIDGRRPVYGGTETFQTDPHWRDHILFYEYFHGDSGAGLGASHQTGWTGLVARLIQLAAGMDPKTVLEGDYTQRLVYLRREKVPAPA